jgi:hypothetical protein
MIWYTSHWLYCTALVNLSHLSATGTIFLCARPQLPDHDMVPATQFEATVMIGYRFWKPIKWNSNGIRESRIPVLWILVESGALQIRRDIRCGARTDQCSLSLSKVVGDTQWDFDVLGIGPDTDYCTGQAERLAFVFSIHACEGIHQRSL